jgi:hypothetical protein
VAPNTQLDLLNESFQTGKPANPLFCHQDFLEKLAEHGKDSIGRRAAFLLQRLAVDAQRLHYKSTQGLNRGWRRSRLGGNHGSHFYAWWAPKNAAPLKESGEFSDVPEDSFFLRDIRHHDDHSLLTPHAFQSHYMPVSVRDLRREEYTPLPFTQPQARFATSRQTVRLLKGYPGSGKTTALLHAADSCGAQRVLYVTYSRNLAALARGYFDRFCSAEKRFHVVTLSDLVRQMLGSGLPALSEQEGKRALLRDLAPYSRTLGAWASIPSALYDELYAHLIGDALPVDIGRFTASTQPRVSHKTYRERRTRYLGTAAASSVLEAAVRLEKLDPTSLADRYFPELALAWRAVEKLRSPNFPPSFLDFDCIAVDECQDLTPIEAMLLVELTALIQRQRRAQVPLMLSGDEAQTVRPTDFEWGWLSDLLHSQLATPAEFKLSANLRSPRRIAELIQRVWDLYSHLQKQERPSGSGQVEIEDDATDQILYCTANPGQDLNDLLISLAATEGLAIINLEETLPAWVPEAARPAVLNVAEAKGLDFNSVCVLDAGRHLERIVRGEERQRSESDVEWLRKRLAIDQLRVALSRPSERLLWLDVNPTDQIVRQSTMFLNGRESGGVASCVPAALLKSLAEDDLDIEERVQRCQTDARQYLDIKPEMAWSRAQQAITLMGRPGALTAVTDEAARRAAYLTLAEVCCVLGLRNARLPAELGRPDLFAEAHRAAVSARRYSLAALLQMMGHLHRATFENRLHALVDLANHLPSHKGEIEPWLRLEMTNRSLAWAEELEAAVINGHNAEILVKLLPPFYEALDLPDRDVRRPRLLKRAIQLLVKDKQFAPALAVLRELPERQPAVEAACYEGLGDFSHAAECHQLAGNLKEALQCYRSIPDFAAALKLVNEIGDHPAADSLRWLSEIQQLVSRRPDKFTKVVTAAEKKLLEEILERSLGVARRKPAPKKAAAVKKKAAPRKTLPARTKNAGSPYF